MTNEATPAVAGAEAQPQADANSVESIIDSALAEQNTTKDQEKGGDSEPKPEAEAEQPWPKKAENALAKEKGKSARLKFERDQERQARADLEQRLAQFNSKQTKANDGPPKEADYENYAEYMEAKNTYVIKQEFSERDSKQQASQQTAQEQTWHETRIAEIDKQAEAFVKEVPEIEEIYNEHAETITEYSPQLKRLFLEAENAPLAFYNLAKEGKIEALGTMSLARAAMEIGRAQSQAIVKPKTNAPKPMPAARGAVAGGKRLEEMEGDDIRSWMRAK